MESHTPERGDRERLARLLREESSLKPQEIDAVRSRFRCLVLDKEVRVCAKGWFFDQLVFVEEGILRIFERATDGTETTKSFVEPGEFFAELECLDKGLPARLDVETVVPSVLSVLSGQDAAFLRGEVPAWQQLVQIGAMRAMNDAFARQTFLRTGTAASKYRHFVEAFPRLAREVPLKHVASFLGITQSSLSRIRKEGW